MLSDKICPNCKRKRMLYPHSVLIDKSITFEVCCSFCEFKTKSYESIKLAIKEINDYENEIF